MVTKGVCGGAGRRNKLGVWNYQIYTFIYKIITNTDLVYSTGNDIQYLVITWNVKESEKFFIYRINRKNKLFILYIYIYIYVSLYLCLNHCTGPQKLTQHRKPAMLQCRFFKLIFLLKDNWFTDFCFFSAKPQCESAIGIQKNNKMYYC